MIEGGEIKIIERDLDVEKTLNLSTKLIKVCAAEKNQILRIDALVHGTKLRADECMVRQILLKLLSNAIKFAKSSVEITIAGELGEDGRLRISVFDTGIGMLDAMSALGQVEGALYQRIEGTALDLPLVKSLAELHDGGFEVNSEVGFGTKATVWFPKERVFSADGSVSSSSSSFDQSSSLYQSTNS
jgi:signal transduction histidine kinase